MMNLPKKRLPLSTAAAIVVVILSLNSVLVNGQDAKTADKTQTARTGKVTKFSFAASEFFPGTIRDVWVYVPAQYSGERPACVAAFCDGDKYMDPKKANYAPAIFDRLIAAGEMPVTIGIFANPGVVPPPHDDALPRYNRSYEYDGLGDTYARFLDEELLPHVAKQYDLRLSDDPNDRLVGGASSGGVCAFNTAWSRPDRFRRVWCTVGTFVGLRGADELHTLVRKTEAKPLRIFLHDGDQDLNIYAGDWWMANQQMQRALEWMGYEHNHIWDDAPHGRQGELKYFADALRYLWKDWPQPVTTHPENAGKRRNHFLLAGKPWELVSKGHKFTDGPAANEKGEVFFCDTVGSTIHKVDTAGKVSEFARDTNGVKGLMFSPDGRMIGCTSQGRQVVAFDEQGTKKVVAADVVAEDLCVRADSTIYFTSPQEKKVFRIPANSDQSEAIAEFPGCDGILLTPDQTQLFVAAANQRMITAYQLTKDGKLAHQQPYFWLHAPYRTDRLGVGGMTVDTEGWLYVASKLGVQICDQAGRVNFIIPMPAGTRHPSNVCFGGADSDYLYATCGKKVYRRKLSKQGVWSWQTPITPKKPRL